MDVGVTVGVLIRKREVGQVCARNCCQLVLSGTVPMRGRSRNRVYIRLVNGICMGSSKVFLEIECILLLSRRIRALTVIGIACVGVLALVAGRRGRFRSIVLGAVLLRSCMLRQIGIGILV